MTSSDLLVSKLLAMPITALLQAYARRIRELRRATNLMAELGWTAVRVRDRTRGGYKEQVRGYVRDGRAFRP
jgi:hypothetical protein